MTVEYIRYDLGAHQAGDLVNAYTIAADALSRWEEVVTQFIKVMPTDYKRVLEEKKSAQIRQVVAVA